MRPTPFKGTSDVPAPLLPPDNYGQAISKIDMYLLPRTHQYAAIPELPHLIPGPMMIGIRGGFSKVAEGAEKGRLGS